MAFGWFTRIILAAGAIGFAFLFFYVLEKRKDWAREERRASFSAPSLKASFKLIVSRLEHFKC